MKRIIILIIFASSLVGCKKLSDLNYDPKNPSTAPSHTFFTNAQRQLMSTLTSANININIFRLIVQYWQETTYTDESNYVLSSRTIPDYLWHSMYAIILRDFQEAKTLIPKDVKDPDISKNQLAITEILQVISWYYIVTTWGNVPYSEALDINKPFPKYDDAKTIYSNLLTRLDAAITALNVAAGSFGAADIIYGGDVAAWKKLANSFKLKLGITIADDDNTLAKQAVETAVAAGVFTSSADDALFHFLSTPPNTNPVWEDLVQSGRKDFVAASTIVDLMINLNDPRLDNYFTLDANGGYSGGMPGASSNYSKPHDAITEPDFPAILLDYTEVEFYLAEAVARNYNVGGTVISHYDNAITSSIESWGGSALDASNYLAQPAVNYLTTPGTFKEKIGNQKWIALYNRGWESWVEWRRLDNPQLAPAVNAVSVIPLRYPYPINEQNVNRLNYDAASLAIGGDDVGTKLWWDKF
jgi:hypothetical protein